MDLLAVGSLQPWPPPVWCKVWVSGAVGRLAAPLVRAVEGLLSPTPPRRHAGTHTRTPFLAPEPLSRCTRCGTHTRRTRRNTKHKARDKQTKSADSKQEYRLLIAPSGQEGGWVADSGGRLVTQRRFRSARGPGRLGHTLHRCVEEKGTGVPVRRDGEKRRLHRCVEGKATGWLGNRRE